MLLSHELSKQCAPMQSGIVNHRAALWTQVRNAFRKNLDETDEEKVICSNYLLHVCA